MPEITAIIKASRDKDYADRKFAAALKGVDLEANSGQKEWEDMKARVASKGQTSDSTDILALQGNTARQKGFGIGMGMEAEIMDEAGNVTKL